MKDILLVIALIISYQNVQSQVELTEYNVTNDCSGIQCFKNTWVYEGIEYKFKCPKAGNKLATILQEGNKYTFNFTAYKMIGESQKVIMPLSANENFQNTGILLQNTLDKLTVLAIYNCSNINAVKAVALCRKHDLVVSKIFNGTIYDKCSFGLNKNEDQQQRVEL